MIDMLKWVTIKREVLREPLEVLMMMLHRPLYLKAMIAHSVRHSRVCNNCGKGILETDAKLLEFKLKSGKK
jgi:hypothetical protein